MWCHLHKRGRNMWVFLRNTETAIGRRTGNWSPGLSLRRGSEGQPGRSWGRWSITCPFLCLKKCLNHLQVLTSLIFNMFIDSNRIWKYMIQVKQFPERNCQPQYTKIFPGNVTWKMTRCLSVYVYSTLHMLCVYTYTYMNTHSSFLTCCFLEVQA